MFVFTHDNLKIKIKEEKNYVSTYLDFSKIVFSFYKKYCIIFYTLYSIKKLTKTKY